MDPSAWLTGQPSLAAQAASENSDEVRPGTEPLTRSTIPVMIAYHDACHLGHAQGVRTQPRALLAAIPGLVLREIADSDLCCGSAGIYNVLNPVAAGELGDRKAANVLQTRAQLLVTANPGCLMQVASSVERTGGRIALAHTVEVLDASIRGLPVESLGV